MSEREDHEKLADELERQAGSMEQHSERLGEDIGHVREDWQRKRSDPSVPGAEPPREVSDRDAPGDDVNPEDAHREEHEGPDEPERDDVHEDVED